MTETILAALTERYRARLMAHFGVERDPAYEAQRSAELDASAEALRGEWRGREAELDEHLADAQYYATWGPVAANAKTAYQRVALDVAMEMGAHPAVLYDPVQYCDPTWSAEGEWTAVVEEILEAYLAASPRPFDHGLEDDFDRVRAEVIERAKAHPGFDATAAYVALRHARSASSEQGE